MRPTLEGIATLQSSEGKEARRKTISKRISPALRHVVQIHRVYLDLMFELVEGGLSFCVRHVNTSDQHV